MGMGSDSGVEASRSSRWDFARLEQSVELLLREHERLSSEREALLAELREREHRLTSLESRLARERDLRKTALERVNKILGRLDQLQTSLPGSGIDERAEGGESGADASRSGLEAPR